MVGCHANPYANSPNEQMASTPAAPSVPESKSNNQTFSIDAPPPIHMPEGTSLVQPIAVHVLSGTPVLNFANCPSFAVCDSTSGTVTLNPQVGDALDLNDPKSTTRVYNITVTLSSSDDLASVIGQNIIVVIHRTSNVFTVSGFVSAAQINEGTTFQTTIQITSSTSSGPFVVSGVNLSSGLTIASTADPTSFLITYTPSFSQVTLENGDPQCFSAFGRACNFVKWNLNVEDPQGNLFTSAASWAVFDVRQNAKVVFPATVSGVIPNTTFAMQVSDPNGEVVPSVTLLSNNPGAVIVSPVVTVLGSSGETPMALVQVQWLGIPPFYSGSYQALSFEVCVKDQYSTMNQCSTTSVAVNF